MSKYFYFVLYILCITVANLTVTNILALPFISLSLGTVFFGFVFTLRDKLHAQGKKTVYFALFVAFLINFLLAIFQGVPLQIVIASNIALLLGEASDTEIFAAVKNKWHVKSLISNSISVVIDSLLFNTIAFYGTELQSQILALCTGDIFIKYIFSGLLILFFSRNMFKMFAKTDLKS